MVQGRVLRRRQYERLLTRLFRDVVECPIEIMPVQDDLVEEANNLVPEYPLRAPDALHFAAALRVYRVVGKADFSLISGDRDLVTAARRYPMQLIDPEDPTTLANLLALG